MQSIGMTNRQLQRLMVYEGVYYAAGADIIGGVVALLLAMTVPEKCLELAIHVVLYSEYYIGSCSGHWCTLSAAGCGHSADRSPLL